MAKSWNWSELVKRFYASTLRHNGQLVQWLEGYLRFAQDDQEARLYLQDLIHNAEIRAATGDPFHHPGANDGISMGTVHVGDEVSTAVPYRCDFFAGGHAEPAINAVVCGPTGSGKSCLAALIAVQLANQARVLVFTRNESFSRKLPNSRHKNFYLLKLLDLCFCPVEPPNASSCPDLAVLQEWTRMSSEAFVQAWARRYKRQDSQLLLSQLIELALRELGTFEPATPPDARIFPSFRDIHDLLRTRRYTIHLHRKSKHEESLALTMNAFAANGRGVLDSRRGSDWLKMLDDSNLIVETDGLDMQDAAMLVELLLARQFLRQQLCGNRQRTFVVLDDFQEILAEGFVEKCILVSRHAGWSLCLTAQSVSRVSSQILNSCGLIACMGAQISPDDQRVVRGLLGIHDFRDPLMGLVTRGKPGRALVRQPHGAYSAPVQLRIPHLREAEIPQSEREAAMQWLRGFPYVPYELQRKAGEQHEPNAQPSVAQDEMLAKYIRSANSDWWAPMEHHFAACGARDGSTKKSIAAQARAMSWTTEPAEGRVIGLNGRRIQLVVVTEAARAQLGLSVPETWKALRGGLPARYYQLQLKRLLEAQQPFVRVDVEAGLGPKLKQVDVAGQLADGRWVAVEFASAANADYEPHNARLFKDAEKFIARYVCVAETGVVRDRVRNLLRDFPGVTVTSFYEFARNPAPFLSVPDAPEPKKRDLPE